MSTSLFRLLPAGEAAESAAQVASDTTTAAQQKAADSAAAAQVGAIDATLQCR